MDASHNGRPFGSNGAASHGATPNGVTPQQAGSTVVMGAGPGGLCSAYVLSKAGVPTTVLEKAPFVGGLARTIRHDTEYGEFKFDIGGHRWFTKNDELNELFREVVAEELLWVNRISRIYFDGKYVDYPLKICNALEGDWPGCGRAERWPTMAGRESSRSMQPDHRSNRWKMPTSISSARRSTGSSSSATRRRSGGFPATR